MKMAKKLLAAALAGVLALSVLTGCSSSVTGKTLVDSLKKLDINVEYDSKANAVAEDTLKAIQTIIDSEENKALAEDKQATLDNAVDPEDGNIIKDAVVIDTDWVKSVIVRVNDGESKSVRKALKMDGENANKEIEVALVKTDKAKEDSSLQAARVKESLTLVTLDLSQNYEETGKLGMAKTKDGKYMLVVIITDIAKVVG